MGISITDKLFLTKNLATMIKAGVPLDQSLETVKEQANSELKALMEKVGKDVENGTSLGEAMAKHPKVFDRFYISLIKAGEQSGSLEINMGFLADQMAKDYALRKKVQGALMYPGLVLGATTVMGTGIAWFVLPQLIDLFTSMDVTLPLSTKILMWLAYFMRDYGAWAVGGVLAVLTSIVLLLRLRVVRRWWDEMILRLPFVGQVAIYGELGKFTRNLSVLLKSGLPVMDALTTTTNTMANLKFIDDLAEAKLKVEDGKTIFESLSNKKYFEFQKLATRMIDVGEKSGNLEDMLMYVSDYYDAEIDNVSKNLSTMLEPVLLVIIGMVVGFVAFAIISPIYSLVGGIKG